VTYRIDRATNDASIVFVLSGEMDADHVSTLRALLRNEASVRVVLDLEAVTLVDRDAVTFLARAEAAGVTLRNCPTYVRTWISLQIHDE